MEVRLVESVYHLTSTGDYTFETNRAGVTKTVILCPSCLSSCRSSAGVMTKEPLTLLDWVVCSHCFAEFTIYEGRIDVKAGTLPPWVQHEAEIEYEGWRFR